MNSIMKIKQRIILIAFLFSFGCIPHSDKRILIGDKWQYLVLSDRFNGDTNGLTFAEAKDVSKLADLLPEGKGILLLKHQFEVSPETNLNTFGIFLGRVNWADKTFINGHFIGETGKFPPNPLAYFNIPRLYPISRDFLIQGKNDLIVEVYVDGPSSAIFDKPILGNFFDLEGIYKLNEIFNVFINALLGLFCLIGSSIFVLIYVKRQSEKHYLYYALSLFLYFLFSINQFIFWYPYLPFETILPWSKFVFSSLFLFFLSTVYFFYHFLKQDSKILLRILKYFSLLSVTGMILAPTYPIFEKIKLVGLMFIPVLMIVIVYWIIISIRKKVRDVKPLLYAFLFSFMLVVHDMIIVIFNIPSFYLGAVLIPAFLGAVTFILVNRFVSVYNEVEEMTVKLDVLNRDLAHKNEELTQLDKLKDDFLANTSHELRTPLNGIIGIAESLMDGATGKLSDETNQNLSMITLSGKRLANLVNSILDFSKMKEQTITLSLKPVSIKQAVEFSIAMAKPLMGDKEVKLINEINSDRLYANADENRFQQILLNIIGNSVKFTESGYVKVSAKQEGEFISIAIEDTGIGIPKDKFEKIFQAFEQVDASTSREYGGTGLGLSITRSLIELHGGTIRVDSEIGKGSVFTILIPLANVNEDAKEIPVPETLADNKGIPQEETLVVTPEYKGPDRRSQRVEVTTDKVLPKDISDHKFRILAVDDEPINLQVLTNQLSLEGFEVMTAVNGMKALEIVENSLFLPELILLDVMMPRMSGYEVCQKIREKHPIAELPIIMLTAKNQLSNLLEGLSNGANDYISKPFSKNELVARIKTHLNVSNISIAYGKFVPMEILNHLHKDSIIELHLGDQIQKEMTILFSDIRSFTNLSETMTPQENFNFLNAYLSRVSPMIRKNNGYIDKFIGDAIMALFAKEPEDALKASIDMQMEIREYNKHRIKRNYEPISTGIGMHTGMLMLGTIGDKDRMEGTVISDSVNLASRVESLSKMYGASILVTDSVFKKISNPEKYYYRVLDRVIVKGKKESVQVIEILNGQPDFKIELFMNTKQYFEMAINSYLMKEFSAAISLFEKVVENNNGDIAAKLYLKRAGYYKEHGVPIDWEGVEVMDHK